MNTNSTDRPVYFVDGSRTPFLKARGKPGPFRAADLAVAAAKPLLLRQPFQPDQFDQVILGCVNTGPDEANIGRVVSLRLGCGDKVTAWTVQRNCASGLQAIDSAFQAIRFGQSDLVLAGGTESMSHAPLLWKEEMVAWLADWNMARNFPAKLKALRRLKLKNMAPIIGLLRGLRDPVVGISMGQTTEKIAHRFAITRAQMDSFAVASHQRLAAAQSGGHLGEIEVLIDSKGNAYEADDGLRSDSSVEKLAKLKPAFDKKFGNVTAGNSAQITDGAAWVILASEEAVQRHHLPVIGRVVDTEWAGVDPSEMGLGPVHAVVPLLQRHQLKPDDIAYWELNEAFAGQVLACMAAWQDAEYCKTHFGLDRAFGVVPHERLNVDGGGVSQGHPVGASGARITLHLLHILRRTQSRYGVATLCIGGGQGGAILLENTEVA
jgi:acetyl-CoA C-acetyltransferase